MVFILNYKIVYGPSATFTDGVDFIKKNKNLMTRIMKVIGGEVSQPPTLVLTQLARYNLLIFSLP
jgi:hypothetical protein